MNIIQPLRAAVFCSSAWTRWPQPEREKQADEPENTHLEYKGLTSGWILDNLHLGQYTQYWSEAVTQHTAYRNDPRDSTLEPKQAPTQLEEFGGAQTPSLERQNTGYWQGDSHAAKKQKIN